MDQLDAPEKNGESAAPRRPSLAVLYFGSEGRAEGVRSLACGITEDAMSRLAELSGLSVASRHDVAVLRRGEVDTADLGTCMGVDWVLGGTVHDLDRTIKAEVRLDRTRADGDGWQETCERTRGSVFDVAPSIARGVVGAVGVRLSPTEQRRLSTPLTRDARAYERHAEGRELLLLRGRRYTEAAIQAFEEALTIDETFGAAQESLAAACSGMFTYYDGSGEWLDRMAAAAGEALEIDASLIEARFHLAMVSLHRREYDRARTGFEEILRMRPCYYEAHLWLGILFDMTADHDNALECYHRAAQIKPCSVEPWLYINMAHRRRGDVPAATDAARKFLEVGLKTLHLVPDDPVTLSRFCVVYTLFDEREKARETLQRVLRTGTEDGLVLYNCAATYALLGDERECLGCLRKALDGGYKNVRQWIETDPDFDLVRGTAGFRDLLQEFDRRYGTGR